MKLLEAEKVKEENKRTEQSRIDRLQKLNDEETTITKRLNDSRENEKKEILLLLHRKKIRDAENTPETETELGVKKALLLLDIEELESRRKKALEPIEGLRQKAEEKFEEAKKMISETQEMRISLSKEKEIILKRTELLVDKESDMREKSMIFDQRESKIKSVETETRRSTEKLSEEWVRFHTEVQKLNKAMAYREVEIENGRRANEEFKKSLDRVEAEQAEKDRQIADRYATLGRAIEEARKKHGISI